MVRLGTASVGMSACLCTCLRLWNMHTSLRVFKSAAEIGYSYGYLLADEIRINYHALLHSLIGDKWYDQVSSACVRSPNR